MLPGRGPPWPRLAMFPDRPPDPRWRCSSGELPSNLLLRSSSSLAVSPPASSMIRILKRKPFRRPDISAPLQEFLEGKERDAGLVVDAGANVAMAAFSASAMGFRVVAIEPVFENLQRICDGVFLNRAGGDRVTVSAVAASDQIASSHSSQVPVADSRNFLTSAGVDGIHRRAYARKEPSASCFLLEGSWWPGFSISKYAISLDTRAPIVPLAPTSTGDGAAAIA